MELLLNGIIEEKNSNMEMLLVVSHDMFTILCSVLAVERK